MKDDNKTTDIEDESTQLGDKEDNPNIDKTINSANIAWTPGDTRPMFANIFVKGGITRSPDTPPKQNAPIRRPLAEG
jgi:hypothetical protein